MPKAPKSQNEVLRVTTENYLNGLSSTNQPDPATIENELLELVGTEYDLENAVKAKGRKWNIPTTLYPFQIAMILLHTHHICLIDCSHASESDYDILGIYQDTGPNEGIYISDSRYLESMIRQYNRRISTREINEVIACLRSDCERKTRCTDRDLIAVNNGIFNYKTKTLMPFDSDYVFIAKSKVNYNQNAMNINFHNPDDNTDWDIESWMNELSDDPEIVNVLWEILGAIIRPHVRWNKSAWFYSNTGNNGKGTLCELMRNLCGEGSYASIPLADFGKDFMLEPLIRASAIIVDENDVGTFIDKAANLKAIITNDVISMNRKFKTPIAYQFYGFMVQCLNEFPRIKDKSDSFYRRQLFIPFTKCFTGHERTYIKNQYLHDPQVLEYVLHKVLHMDYYQLSEPAACVQALNDYKEINDPIRQFANEILPQCKWDLLPFDFLYDLYKSWFKQNLPSGSIQNKTTFITELLNVLPTIPNWTCPDRTKQVRTSTYMDKSEPLILEYDLTKWKNPYYRGNDTNQICRPVLATKYRGLSRLQPSISTDDDMDNESE